MERRINVVTGGKGYVGFALVKELASRDEDIRLLLRSDSPVFDKIKCEKIMGDICDVDTLEKAFEGADTVYHIAGVVDISGKKDKQVWAVNFEGTKNVVEACKKCGVKNLVYCSSVDAIPVDDNDGFITEISSFNPDLLEGAYAKSKAAATQYVLDESKNSAFKACVVHPSCCIGPYDYNDSSSVGTMINMFMKGLFPVTLDFGGYNFVDVRDVAKGIVAAAEKGRNGECYLLSGNPHTIDEFIKCLAYVCDRKAPKFKLKKSIIMKLLPEIERTFDILKLPPVLNDYSVRKLCESYNFSYKKAETELDYHPRSLEESLGDTIAWIKSRRIDEEEQEAKAEMSRKFSKAMEKLEKEYMKDQEKAQEKFDKKREKI